MKKTTTVSFKIPLNTKKKLQWLAEEEGKSISEYLRDYIENANPRKRINKKDPFLDFFGSVKIETKEDEEVYNAIKNARKK